MDYCGIGAVPFSVGCYAVYVNLDKLWQERHVRFTSLQNFINGCLAAGVAQTLSFPFETVKKKMQVRMKYKVILCFATRRHNVTSVTDLGLPKVVKSC